jgi:DNA repair protein RadC
VLDVASISLGKAYTRRLVTVGLVREGVPEDRQYFRSASEVYADLRGLAMLDREAFVVLHLDLKNRVNGLHVVSIGSLAASLVHPREVWKAAILTNAAAILVAHNHPSGDPTPSREDREITARLKLCGDLLGIPLIDHVVIGSESYRSFAESGLL